MGYKVIRLRFNFASFVTKVIRFGISLIGVKSAGIKLVHKNARVTIPSSTSKYELAAITTLSP